MLLLTLVCPFTFFRFDDLSLKGFGRDGGGEEIVSDLAPTDIGGTVCRLGTGPDRFLFSHRFSP